MHKASARGWRLDVGWMPQPLTCAAAGAAPASQAHAPRLPAASSDESARHHISHHIPLICLCLLRLLPLWWRRMALGRWQALLHLPLGLRRQPLLPLLLLLPGRVPLF